MMVANSFAASARAADTALPAKAVTEAIAQARALVLKEMAAKVPGMSVAVAIDSNLVWSEAFGYADLEAKKPATTMTRFRIGSVSKPLSAAGLALLIEQGKIDLDAPVQKYIPDFPQKPEGVITTRLLAGHLSGIRNYRGSELFSTNNYPDLHAGLAIFENDSLIAPPGTKFNYASYNWNTIGVVMENAAGKNYLRYMDDAVIQPLNLTNTVADLPGADDPQRTQFYETQAAGKFVVAPRVNLSFVWPAGGYLSTTEDMVHFGTAMLQPGLLKAESLRLLFTSQATRDGKPTGYGVGWSVTQNTYFHGGDSVGGAAMLLLVPRARLVLALACNRGHIAVKTGENGRLQSVKMPEEMVYDRETLTANLAKIFIPVAAEVAKAKKSGVVPAGPAVK